ncbi:hypothetical protein [endosymbiont GvMRE of Glomus versiforme]|uniref:hypothetical protein n=1 Tax=endosymbiont GvMRE of Glomus versiforme TaxID=2039283 RepID=UPI000EBF4973|nr:hypothetical protein [endosymbiont GvMRE of Glomus versiforme]RHZ37620.1 hypothetical protein GvMRE_I1g37 [endosymbiont GvMRE of Glomus versiforme]
MVEEKKDKLQQELNKKIKLGVKPSDLKKQKAKNSQTNSNQLLTPPLTPPLKPVKEISDQNPKIIQTQHEVIVNQQKKLNQAQDRIKELEKSQKEKQKELKKKLNKEIKEIVKEDDKPSEVKKKVDIRNSVGLDRSQKTFNILCDTCGNYKPNEHLNLKKLNSGLGMDLTKLYQMCDDCVNSGRWDLKTERKDDWDPINW